MRLVGTRLARRRAPGTGPSTGGALALVLILVITVAGLAAGLLQINQAASARQAAATNIKLAFYTAESGLAEAYGGLMIGKTGNVGTPEVPAALGAGLFWVEAAESADGTIDLTSTGMVGNGRAILSLVVERREPGVATLGLFSHGPLDLKPGSLIDGYDSENGSYQSQLVDGLAPAGAGRVGSNGPIAVSGSADMPTLINGDVTPGSLQGVALSGDVTVVGSTAAGAATPLPPVAVPDVALQPGVVHGSGVPMLLQPGQRGVRSLQVMRGAEVVLQGPSSLVIGNLKLWPQATLTFDTRGGRIDLYVIDALHLEPGSLVSTPGRDPSLVSIQIPGAPAAPARFGATGPFHGVIYAPEANLMVAGSFEVYGALLGGTLFFGGPARLHFDHRLNRLAAEMALPRLLSWRIVELSNPQGARAGTDPFQFLGLDRAALPSPAQAHADQLIQVEYEDLGGLARVYDGLESAFDWTSATAVTRLTRDGAAVNPEGPRSETALPTPLLDVVRNSDLLSSQVRDQVLAATPVSSQVLLAVAERTPPMVSSHLKAIFEVNAPTLDPPLKVLVVRGQMSSSDLKEILVLNSPLSTDILDRTLNRAPPMSAPDLQAVLDAQ